ncbi:MULTISPECIES: beta-L-arabinofuranosidase domain-containing protein [unclassified Streptomyces]|uniref:glycoside hydrolase family 127 protein n=1 Tax=unclassified Streptomyces TaxID=2593676 RepID=UPI0025B37E7C|nr:MULTISPECIES: beta-L-arabinofuranosidase domain-containing protein [unclassified Streptomyces]MDN3244890.1 glycoside hydrolase family 127 protein [Streptomyces sp. ZSW22]MDN3254345.1 glycoside hydrolase family 127 protein [Streptomyces sp. MA25(2023)]
MTDSSPTPLRAEARPVAAPGRRRGLGVGELRLDGGFWGRLQETNARATLQHCLDWMERLGWLANFDRVAAGTTGPDRSGWHFSDSEAYKLLEALAWEHGRTGDPAVEAMLAKVVDRVAAAQDDDGYLNTSFGHPGRPGRYTDLSSGHELYCTGHLLQAAVARARTVGPDDRLVDVARRAADHVCREFGVGGNQGICGHPEIEVGLAELGRALGEPRYTQQARLFVERRGRGTLTPIALLSPAYFQDDVPVRDADVWRGHAVRALYLSAGAVDVAVDTGDEDLRAAVERQWARTVERRTYLTGGMGSRHQDEGFGDDFELPPDRAYCETCAGVASVMVSWRLLLATGDVRYADLIERTLYNVVATSPRADGRAFFYANPLQQREPGADMQPDAVNPRAEGGVRAPWFDVSCCPTNVARTLASWQAYAAMVEDGAGPGGDRVVVTLAQYAAGDMRVALGGPGSGRDHDDLVLRVDTAYPHKGEVRVDVLRAPSRPVTLRLRVPHWAAGENGGGATVTVPDGVARPAAPGWVDIEVHAGDTVRLELPVAPRLTWPDPRIDAARGTVAVERGPLVLALESVDLPDGVTLEQVRLDPGVAPRVPGADDRSAGAHRDGAIVTAHVEPLPDTTGGMPPFGPAAGRPTPVDTHPEQAASAVVELPLIPYHRWAERGPSTMRVHVPTVQPNHP